MGDPNQNELSKQLEVDGHVPEYLKKSLVSEIEFIKDTLQVVSLFGGVFFLSAFRAVTSVSDDQNPDDKPL